MPVSGYVSYQWQDGWPEQTYTVWNSGTYIVEVEDPCGNTQRDTIEVAIGGSLGSALDIGTDTQVCEGANLSFSLDGYSDVQWQPANLFDCPTCPTATATITASVEIVVTAISPDGCTEADSIMVELTDEIQTSEDMPLCEGDTISIFQGDLLFLNRVPM